MEYGVKIFVDLYLTPFSAVKRKSFYRLCLNQLAVFDRPGHGRVDSYQHACSRPNHITQLTLCDLHEQLKRLHC